MEVPYYLFLIVYAVAFLIYAFFAFFNVYHMVRFGFFDFIGKLHTVLLFGVVIAIIFVTGLLLSSVPWTGSFTVFDLDVSNLTYERL